MAIESPESDPETLRVAVASTDGRVIDMHFGHVEAFRVYRVDVTGVHFLESRDVEHYCQGGYGDEDKREVILRALADCSALFVARAGEGPKARLREAGIEPVDAFPFALVESAILEWLGQGAA
jgi:nitrogen fixation protein NifB